MDDRGCKSRWQNRSKADDDGVAMPIITLPEAIESALQRGARLHDLVIMMYGETNAEAMYETAYGAIKIRHSPYVAKDDVYLCDLTMVSFPNFQWGPVP